VLHEGCLERVRVPAEVTVLRELRPPLDVRDFGILGTRFRGRAGRHLKTSQAGRRDTARPPIGRSRHRDEECQHAVLLRGEHVHSVADALKRASEIIIRTDRCAAENDVFHGATRRKGLQNENGHGRPGGQADQRDRSSGVLPGVPLDTLRAFRCLASLVIDARILVRHDAQAGVPPEDLGGPVVTGVEHSLPQAAAPVGEQAATPRAIKVVDVAASHSFRAVRHLLAAPGAKA